MSIEEMKTMRGLIDSCIAANEIAERADRAKRGLSEIHESDARAYEELHKENDAINEDNNRLREENANLHNQVTELTAERDDARHKLFEWARFLNFHVYENLLSALRNNRRRRAIVKEIVVMMKDFREQNPITITEGGMAK